MRDPFRPSFGTSPPELVGRDAELDAMADALDGPPGDLGRATMYTGARGVGKTVMLNAAEDLARERGWLVATVTAGDAMLDALVREELPKTAARLETSALERRVSGVELPANLGAVSFDVIEHNPVTLGLRTQIEALSDQLSERGSGLMISVDELHGAALPGLRVLTAAVQHSFREERQVAFVGAGLPAAVSELLADDPLTFLRRADRHVLGSVDLDEVADGLRIPMGQAGYQITPSALEAATHATGGYPFLIQLIGRGLCRSADNHQIDDDAVSRGVSWARRRLASLVHAPALQDLSDVDRTFLVAMAADDGPARQQDIAGRLNVSATYASQYRLRLLEAGLIQAVRHGYVDFAMPYMREYLREHAVVQAGSPEDSP